MKRASANIITKEQYAQERNLAIKPEEFIPGADGLQRRAFTIGEAIVAYANHIPPIFCAEEKISFEGIERAKSMFAVSFHYIGEDGTTTGNATRLVDEDGIIMSRWRRNERGYFLPMQDELGTSLSS